MSSHLVLISSPTVRERFPLFAFREIPLKKHKHKMNSVPLPAPLHLAILVQTSRCLV
jgi:hypothetical protein